MTLDSDFVEYMSDALAQLLVEISNLEIKKSIDVEALAQQTRDFVLQR
jgi:hypothetical protein